MMKKFFLLISLLLILPMQHALCWSGFDPIKNTTIEIYSGNYTQEGDIFEFYEDSTGQMIEAQVIERNYLGNSTELRVITLANNQERILEME